MTAEEQLAAIRAKLSELFGLAQDANEEQFNSAFDKYIKDAGDNKGGEKATTTTDAAGAEAQKKQVDGYKNQLQTMADQHRKDMDGMVARYEDALSALKGRNSEIDTELGKLKAAAITAEHKAFQSEVENLLNGLVKEGKMLPAELPAHKTILVGADRVTKHKFADAAGKEAEATAFDSMVSALKSRPVIMKFSDTTQVVNTETTTKVDTNKAPEGIQRFEANSLTINERSAKVDARTRELMAEKNLGYGAAMVLAAKEIK